MFVSRLRGVMRASALASCLVSSSLLAGAEPTEEIVIKGQLSSAADVFVATPTRAAPNLPDTAELMQLVPGGDVASNGPLSGQLQYRGLTGDRIATRIDGMPVDPGGPNLMDPPLHYAPRPLLDALEVDLGIPSVSRGSETLGGFANARLKRSEFTDGSEYEYGGDLEISGRTVDSAFGGGGLLSVANERHRLHLLGSHEFGRNYRAGEGVVVPSQFRRTQIGAGYGLRLEPVELGIDYRYDDTGPTGTPALPMDIALFQTDLLRGDGRFALGPAEVEVAAFWSEIDHEMNNFGLRGPPPPAMLRRARAHADGAGWDLRGSLPLLGGELRAGTDGYLTSHDMRITNPTAAAFFIENFNDVHRDRYGLFAEWIVPVSWLDLELGVRYTHVASRAGEVDSTPSQLLPPPMRLRDQFNAADRRVGDDLVDVVARIAVTPLEGLRLQLSGARKMRAPSYLERYAWLPLEVSGGLADGHNYVGQIGLEPEKSYEVEGGIEWRWNGLYLSPRAFYRQIDDYIQGTPSTDSDVITVSTLNGDPDPLVFSNVGAQLFGIDAGYGLKLPFDLQIDGTIGWVRGKRRDIVDDLYRIAPVQGRTTLSWNPAFGSVGIEGLYAGRQSHVSVTNGETPTDGWAILNLFASWRPWEGLALAVGLDNMLDEPYADHLAGTNRVASSAAAVGDKVPAPGRSFWARVHGTF